MLVKGRLTFLILVFAGSHLFISRHDVNEAEGSFRLDVLFGVPSVAFFERLLVTLGFQYLICFCSPNGLLS